MKVLILKTILSQVAMYLINLGYNLLFNYVDKDKDGKWSKSEVESFVKLISQKAKARIAENKASKLK